MDGKANRMKLRLEDLKVESFVTVKEEELQRVGGGSGTSATCGPCGGATGSKNCNCSSWVGCLPDYDV